MTAGIHSTMKNNWKPILSADDLPDEIQEDQELGSELPGGDDDEGDKDGGKDDEGFELYEEEE